MLAESTNWPLRPFFLFRMNKIMTKCLGRRLTLWIWNRLCPLLAVWLWKWNPFVPVSGSSLSQIAEKMKSPLVHVLPAHATNLHCWLLLLFIHFFKNLRTSGTCLCLITFWTLALSAAVCPGASYETSLSLSFSPYKLGAIIITFKSCGED